MSVKYEVSLSGAERAELKQLTRQGKIAARKMRRAQTLLLADEGHKDETISQMLGSSVSTVHRTRKKFVESGVEAALSELPRAGAKRKLVVSHIDSERWVWGRSERAWYGHQ